MRKICLISAASVAVFASFAGAAATLAPLSSFGGDGWLSPAEFPAFGSANETRGFSYNSVSGNLAVVTRTGSAIPAPNGPQVRILSGTTGAQTSVLNQGTGIVAGGTFLLGQAGHGDDGALYVANLSGSNFRVYRWADEAAATTPTLAFGGNTTFPRIGDAFDVTGSGANTRIIGSGTGTNGISLLSTVDGLNYTHTAVAKPNDNQRLGLSFTDASNFIGKETSSPYVYGDLSSATSSNGTLLTSPGEAPLDYAVINGVPILATIDANNSTVRVYNLASIAAPILLASGNLTSGTLVGNANGVGQVKITQVGLDSAVIYALSTNQGIQAFSLTGVEVPEPTTLALVGALGVIGLRRRK